MNWTYFAKTCPTLLALCLVTTLCNTASAQVGINTTNPNPSAALDVTATDKGVLVPRMTEAQRNAIASPATGLLVFQNDGTAGFHYYDGATWQALGGTPKLVQDADADTKIEVEKTADDDLVRFSLGGTEHFRMNKGTIEVMNTGGSVFMGRLAGLNENYDAGNQNVGIGLRALQNTIGAFDNVGIGAQSLFSNEQGSHNTAAGSQSLRSNDGYYNVGLGAFAGVNNTTGNGNIFLGYRAGENELGSNKLYIANSGTASPLIYGDFSSKKITVNDSLQSKYFTMTNGAYNGFILKTDALGNATWTDPANIPITETDPKIGLLSSNYIPKWNGTSLANGTIFDNNSKIGIGTTTPANKLDISGNAVIGSSYTNVNSTAPNDGLAVQGTLNVGMPEGFTDIDDYKFLVYGDIQELTAFGGTNSLGTWHHMENTSSGGQWDQVVTGTDNSEGSGHFLLRDNTAVRMLVKKGSGDVGIGTVSPEAKLDVNGNLKTVGLQLPTGATEGYILKTDDDGNAAWIDPASYAIASTWTPDGSNQYSALSGNVGIGISNPTAKLHVDGDARLSGRLALNTPVMGNLGGALSFPRFEMRSNSSLASDMNFVLFESDEYAPWLNIGHAGGTAGAPAALTNGDGVLAIWGHGHDGAGFQRIGGLELQVDGNVSAGSLPTNLKFYTSNNGEAYITERMRISSAGNVGIGTISPSEKLDVNGKAKAVQLQMTTGASNGYVLKSDAAGNATWVDPATLPAAISTKIQDADGNTKIDVEETPDENLVRFHIGGINHFTMNSGRLEVSQTGGSIIIGEGAGFGDDFNNRGNTFIGDGAGRVNYGTGSNVVLGNHALYDNETGAENVAIGASAIENNVTGSQNTVLGKGAGANSTGSKNVFIGYQAGANETGSEKLYIDNSNTITPLLHGDFLNDKLTVNGSLGVGNTSPASTLDVSGSIGLTVKGAQVAGTNHPDATGGIWIYTSGTGTITLPTASDCPNRMYVVANKTGATRNISSFTNLSGNAQSTIANAASFWLVSDGAGWEQVK